MSQAPIEAQIPKKIAIIIGSTRPNRIGDQVVSLIKSILETTTDSKTLTAAPTLSIVDIAAFNLPLFDEPILPASVPAHGEFSHDHSKIWHAEVEKYDGYVFVTAEWNTGVPGATKNAIDYLYHAWSGKPIMIVSYGIFGGTNASDSLKATFTNMGLKVVQTRVAMAFPGRDAAQRNMSPGLMSAVGGKLLEEVKQEWREAKTEEILKAYGELQEKLFT